MVDSLGIINGETNANKIKSIVNLRAYDKIENEKKISIPCEEKPILQETPVIFRNEIDIWYSGLAGLRSCMDTARDKETAENPPIHYKYEKVMRMLRLIVYHVPFVLSVFVRGLTIDSCVSM